MSLIDDYLELTENGPSPRIFKLWSAISMVAACLERRVWHHTGGPSPFYPNVFVLLVANPGIGKSQAINPVAGLLRKSACFHIAPMDVTRAALLEYLADDKVRERVELNGELIEYHSAMMISSEFGVLVQGHEINFMSMFCALYDCDAYIDNSRIHRSGKDLYIPNPQITLLAGTQPKFLAVTFPEAAWSQGFMARMIMVHSKEKHHVDLYRTTPWNGELELSIVERLQRLKKMQGPFPATEAAENAIRDWHFGGEVPVPTNPRLLHYNGRRLAHLLKLCMVSAASDCRQSITLPDFRQALKWLLDAEETMPFVFRDMAGLTEARVIREMHDWAIAQYVANGYKPIQKAQMISFLKDKVPSYALFQTFQIAVECGAFEQVAGKANLFTPQPKVTWLDVE